MWFLPPLVCTPIPLCFQLLSVTLGLELSSSWRVRGAWSIQFLQLHFNTHVTFPTPVDKLWKCKWRRLYPPGPLTPHFTRALTSPTPYQRELVCETCTGTASLVALLDSSFKRSSLRFLFASDIIIVFPAKTQKTDNSNLHGFELHRPSSKGTKLLIRVVKAIINQLWPLEI